MQSSRVFLVDPHMTDEVFTPIRFFIRKRKGLNKYGYFSDVSFMNNKVNICTSNAISGVIPVSLFKLLPCLFRSISLNLELFFWSKLNNIKICKGVPQRDDIAIFFLRNLSEEANRYIIALRKAGVKIAWATSHFHLSYSNRQYVDDKDIVFMDNKLPSPIELRGKDIISPPAVNGKFKILALSNTRFERVLCVGTVHMYQKPFKGSIEHQGVFTMHPSRCDLFHAKSPFLEKNYSVITDDVNLYTSQRTYMGGDLPYMYNSYRFAFVGSEACGVAALGVFEAMACGCELFIEQDVGKNLGLLDGLNAWFFDGTSKSLLDRLSWILNNNEHLDQEAIKSILSSVSLYKFVK